MCRKHINCMKSKRKFDYIVRNQTTKAREGAQVAGSINTWWGLQCSSTQHTTMPLYSRFWLKFCQLQQNHHYMLCIHSAIKSFYTAIQLCRSNYFHELSATIKSKVVEPWSFYDISPPLHLMVFWKPSAIAGRRHARGYVATFSETGKVSFSLSSLFAAIINVVVVVIVTVSKICGNFTSSTTLFFSTLWSRVLYWKTF